MNNKDENGLLPCPFCGEKPLIRPQCPSIEGDAWTKITCDCRVEPSVTVYEDNTHFETAKHLWNTRPQQSPSGDVQLALDALNDAEECFQPETLEELRKHFGTIRAVLTAQQPDVNQELLDALKYLEAKIRQKKGFYAISVGHDEVKKSHKAGVLKGLDAVHTEVKQAIARAEQKDGV